MSFQLICTQCGKENNFGQMFCRECGARLNPRSVKRIRQIKLGSLLAGVFRVFFFFLVVTILGLLVWKVEPLGQTGDVTHAGAFEKKVLRLERAIEREDSIQEVMSESQVNAYFAQVVSNTLVLATEKQFMEQVIRQINVTFTPDSFTVLILTEWGPFQLSHELKGVPVVGENGFSVELAGARLGHLPLPVMIRERMSHRVMAVFRDMSREHDVLNKLKSFALGDKRIFVST